MAGVISTDRLMEQLQLPGQRMLDVRSSFAVYGENHIPGAAFLHLETLRMSEGGCLA